MDRSIASVLDEEDRLWHELWDLVAAFPGDAASEPGYFEEGWSAKDALAHVGTWLAEAGAALERIRAGTYLQAPTDSEIHEMNGRFLEAMRDLSLTAVQAQSAAARTRLRHAVLELGEPDDTGASWIRKAGPEHYREHLPRMRAWLDEVRAARTSA